MSRMIELPDSLYLRLKKVADASGTTLVDWLEARLPEDHESPRTLSDEENVAANARLYVLTASLGYAVGADNEGIDADLARDYGDDHADLYRSSGNDK